MPFFWKARPNRPSHRLTIVGQQGSQDRCDGRLRGATALRTTAQQTTQKAAQSAAALLLLATQHTAQNCVKQTHDVVSLRLNESSNARRAARALVSTQFKPRQRTDQQGHRQQGPQVHGGPTAGGHQRA